MTIKPSMDAAEVEKVASQGARAWVRDTIIAFSIFLTLLGVAVGGGYVISRPGSTPAVLLPAELVEAQAEMLDLINEHIRLGIVIARTRNAGDRGERAGAESMYRTRTKLAAQINALADKIGRDNLKTETRRYIATFVTGS